MTKTKTPNRVPIKIIRIPWEELFEKYYKYIRYAANSVYYQFHTESPEDLVQEGQLLLYQCWEKYGMNEPEEFAKLFKASLWRKLRELSGRKRILSDSLEELYESGVDPGYTPNVTSILEQSERLRAVVEKIKDNPIALTILNEYINPSERTLWEAKMRIARKKCLRNQGYAVNAPKVAEPCKEAIYRGMGITKHKFKENFRVLKDVMKEVYEIQESDSNDNR